MKSALVSGLLMEDITYSVDERFEVDRFVLLVFINFSIRCGKLVYIMEANSRSIKFYVQP
jgi:hypothetical protein